MYIGQRSAHQHRPDGGKARIGDECRIVKRVVLAGGRGHCGRPYVHAQSPGGVDELVTEGVGAPALAVAEGPLSPSSLIRGIEERL